MNELIDDKRQTESGGRVALQIEHAIPNFDDWKRAFDSDPVGRVASGVRQYQVLRPLGDPNYVLINLEFNTLAEAERLLEAMRRVWGSPGHSVSSNQQARIVVPVESRSY